MEAAEFQEYYKTISNHELMQILANPDDYQPAAIEEAKKELAERNLSATQIKEAENVLVEQQSKVLKQKEKIKAIEGKVKAAGDSFFDIINPIQSGKPTAEKIIRFIVIALILIYIYSFLKEFRFIRWALEDISSSPTETILVLLPYALILPGIILFWKRRSSGWTLLAICLVIVIFTLLASLIQAIQWKPAADGLLNNLFPRPDIPQILLQLLFPGATLYAICREDVRKVYGVSKNEMITTILIIAIPFAVFMFAYTNG